MLALFEYITEIKVLEDRKKAFIYSNGRHISKKKEKEEFSNYYFADSYLLRFELDEEKKKGRFFFYNVTYCDAIQETIDNVNIIITFTEISSIKFQGFFDFEFLKGAKCYANKFDKISEETYRFSFMCIVNYEYFIIELTYSGVSIDNFEYDWDSRNNWLDYN